MSEITPCPTCGGARVQGKRRLVCRECNNRRCREAVARNPEASRERGRRSYHKRRAELIGTDLTQTCPKCQTVRPKAQRQCTPCHLEYRRQQRARMTPEQIRAAREAGRAYRQRLAEQVKAGERPPNLCPVCSTPKNPWGACRPCRAKEARERRAADEGFAARAREANRKAKAKHRQENPPQPRMLASEISRTAILLHVRDGEGHWLNDLWEGNGGPVSERAHSRSLVSVLRELEARGFIVTDGWDADVYLTITENGLAALAMVDASDDETTDGSASSSQDDVQEVKR